MSNTDLQCPHCYSTNLRIVGCYVYSPNGVPVSPTFSFLDLNVEGAFASKKLLNCGDCNKHSSMDEVTAGTALAETALHWEKAINGRKIPLICPVCKNNKTFVQERLLLLEQSHEVSVTDTGGLELAEFLTDDSRETIVLRYLCSVEGCSGNISINDDTFKVSPL